MLFQILVFQAESLLIVHLNLFKQKKSMFLPKIITMYEENELIYFVYLKIYNSEKYIFHPQIMIAKHLCLSVYQVQSNTQASYTTSKPRDTPLFNLLYKMKNILLQKDSYSC